MRDLRTKILKYIVKIAQNEPKSIKEKMEEQDKPTIPAAESKDEKHMYHELLKLLKEEKAPIIEVEEEKIEKEAAPKGVKDKALWNKLEKNVREYGKYKEEQIYKVVQKAYQKAGGEYSHKKK